ncbi:MAG TPA: DUF1440 domain-containing protein [Pyrinomonadaceae bacterium]|nr:DUF1440 domain-containing protein [Pyrinomonadaceae bacterium]
MHNRPQASQNSGANLTKGLAAGIVAGFVASAVMNQFQKVLGEIIIGEERSHGAQSLQTGAPRRGAGRMLEERGVEDPKDDSAERLAQTISVGVFDHELSESEKDKAGTAFHYAYGVSMGAAYGLAAEVMPEATIGEGMPYGALIWVGADEIVVPMLGLSKSAGEYSLPVLASAFAAHLVYGLTLETTRRVVRNAL